VANGFGGRSRASRARGCGAGAGPRGGGRFVAIFSIAAVTVGVLRAQLFLDLVDDLHATRVEAGVDVGELLGLGLELRQRGEDLAGGDVAAVLHALVELVDHLGGVGHDHGAGRVDDDFDQLIVVCRGTGVRVGHGPSLRALRAVTDVHPQQSRVATASHWSRRPASRPTRARARVRRAAASPTWRARRRRGATS